MLRALWTRRRIATGILLLSLLLTLTLGGLAYAEHQRKAVVVELIRDLFGLQPERRDFDQAVFLVRPGTFNLERLADAATTGTALKDFLDRNQLGEWPDEQYWLEGELPLVAAADARRVVKMGRGRALLTQPAQAIFLSAVGLSADHREAWVCLRRGFNPSKVSSYNLRRLPEGWRLVPDSPEI